MNSGADDRLVNRPYRNAFLPFAALVLWAYWAGAISLDPIVNTTRGMIRVAMVLFVPAYVLTLFRSLGDGFSRHAAALWTFSGLAYLIHFYWAVFLHYGGFAETIQGQGPWIAWGNYFLTAWWVLDLAWIGRSPLPVRQLLRFILQTVVLVTMLATALARTQSSVQLIAWGMILVVGVAVLLRILSHVRRAPTASSPA